jgi:beta-phosphoglucomutase-like phosphatase (HAD superfamily)
VVGASREVATSHIIQRLDLAETLPPLLAEHGDASGIELLTRLRKTIYDDMVSDLQVIRDNRWPHTIDLLRTAKETLCRTALATMSHREETLHVLRALDIEDSLEAVLSREDVREPKPDPDIYVLAAQRLGTAPEDCLVIEDSPNGARAAIAAGMDVIAMATPFTTMRLHANDGISHAWIVPARMS